MHYEFIDGKINSVWAPDAIFRYRKRGEDFDRYYQKKVGNHNFKIVDNRFKKVLLLKSIGINCTPQEAITMFPKIFGKDNKESIQRIRASAIKKVWSSGNNITAGSFIDIMRDSETEVLKWDVIWTKNQSGNYYWKYSVEYYQYKQRKSKQI